VIVKNKQIFALYPFLVWWHFKLTAIILHIYTRNKFYQQ
jgi:hypothetical protein